MVNKSKIQLWKSNHVKKSGEFVNDAAKNTYEKMIEYEATSVEEGAEQIPEDDILVAALGQRSGYQKGMGYGVELARGTNSIAKTIELQAQLQSSNEKIENLTVQLGLQMEENQVNKEKITSLDAQLVENKKENESNKETINNLQMQMNQLMSMVNGLSTSRNEDMVKSSFISKPTGGASASAGMPRQAPGAGTSHTAPSPTRSMSRDIAQVTGPTEPDPTARDIILAEANKAKHGKRPANPPGDASHKRPKRAVGQKNIPQAHPIHNGPYSFNTTTSLPEILVRKNEDVPQQLIEAYAIRHPAATEIKNQIDRETYCPGERAWFDHLPVDALFMQTSRYLEMVRCGTNAAWLYAAQLEEKARRQEEGGFISGEVERLSASLQAASLENSKIRDEANLKLSEMTTRIAELEEGLKAKEMDKRVAESQAKDWKESHVKLSREHKAALEVCKDLEQKEEAWRKEKSVLEERCKFTDVEKEAFKDIYYHSEECQRRLGGEIYPHWQRGIRIGIRQAVARFRKNPTNIDIFEPDYDDHFGEPEIDGSDDEATPDAAS